MSSTPNISESAPPVVIRKEPFRLRAWHAVVSATHLVAVAAGIAGGISYERGQPHPPKAGEVGFSLIDCHGNDMGGPTCNSVALVVGTDGLLHPATSSRPEAP